MWGEWVIFTVQAGTVSAKNCRLVPITYIVSKRCVNRHNTDIATTLIASYRMSKLQYLLVTFPVLYNFTQQFAHGLLVSRNLNRPGKNFNDLLAKVVVHRANQSMHRLHSRKCKVSLINGCGSTA